MNMSDYNEFLSTGWDDAFVTWMCDACCSTPTVLFAITVQMYDKDAEVKAAFEHMKAGDLSIEDFHKLVVTRYLEYSKNI